MDIDPWIIIGFIGAVSAAGMLGLSYLGAYFIGYNRARRELERASREEEREDVRTGHAERMLLVESSLDSIAQALERLTDAQRLVLLEQARAASGGDRRPDSARLRPHNTPT